MGFGREDGKGTRGSVLVGWVGLGGSVILGGDDKGDEIENADAGDSGGEQEREVVHSRTAFGEPKGYCDEM